MNLISLRLKIFALNDVPPHRSLLNDLVNHSLSAFLGALIFSAAVVAQAAARLLSAEDAALLPRSFWATYHRFAVIAPSP